MAVVWEDEIGCQDVESKGEQRRKKECLLEVSQSISTIKGEDLVIPPR